MKTQQKPKTEWKEEELENVCTLITDGTHEITPYVKEGYPMISSKHLKEEGIDFSKVKYVSEETHKSIVSRSNPEINDILFAKIGTIGNATIIKTDREFSIKNVALFKVNKEKLSVQYLKYFLDYVSRLELINKITGGTNQKYIPLERLRKFQIPLPPLPAQSLIVSAIESRFSKIDNAIKNLKSAKAKIQLYRKAVLKKAFEKGEDWEEKKIGEVFITNPQKNEIKDLSDDLDISFIPMKFVSEKSKKIINQETKKLSQVRKGYTYFKDDDVILAKITPCFENGKMAIAKELINGIGFGSTEYHVFRTQKEVITPFLFYFLQQNKFKGEAKRNMTGTAGQLRVPIKFIENYHISFPPSLSTQQSIVSSIESKFSVIDKVEEIVNNSLKKAEKLKKSILKSAFEGRLIKE